MADPGLRALWRRPREPDGVHAAAKEKGDSMSERRARHLSSPTPVAAGITCRLTIRCPGAPRTPWRRTDARGVRERSLRPAGARSGGLGVERTGARMGECGGAFARPARRRRDNRPRVVRLRRARVRRRADTVLDVRVP